MREGWGAGGGQLRHTETDLYRPVIEYTSTPWDTTSKTNKSKLDRAQKMGTPIQQMEKIADFQPLEYRREYKAVIQGEKLNRLASHPLYQKLQHGKKEFQAQVEGPTKQKC